MKSLPVKTGVYTPLYKASKDIQAGKVLQRTRISARDSDSDVDISEQSTLVIPPMGEVTGRDMISSTGSFTGTNLVCVDDVELDKPFNKLAGTACRASKRKRPAGVCDPCHQANKKKCSHAVIVSPQKLSEDEVTKEEMATQWSPQVTPGGTPYRNGPDAGTQWTPQQSPYRNGADAGTQWTPQQSPNPWGQGSSSGSRHGSPGRGGSRHGSPGRGGSSSSDSYATALEESDRSGYSSSNDGYGYATLPEESPRHDTNDYGRRSPNQQWRKNN